jgi:hypothetical protein
LTEPLHPIDPRRSRALDPVTRTSALTPVERELERERREQARKRRRNAAAKPPADAATGDGHVDLRA